MNKRKTYSLDFGYRDIVKPKIGHLYFFDIFFSTSSYCLFQAVFSSMITPRNLFEMSIFN